MRNFLIDTDTASDDAVAIMMALAEPSVRVLGLTTVAGNVGLKQATRNALLTAEICGSDVPVFAGADRPLNRAHEDAHWFHGQDGLGDHGYPAPKRKPERERGVDAVLRLAEAEPGLTLVTLGPLTNIAVALERDPKLAERIGRCVVMGSAPCCEGNVTPAAEYNIWVDPEAARAVFRSKLNIEMVGWHVSREPSVLRDDEIAAIETLGTAKAKFAIESNSRAREAYHVQTGEVGLSLADPTAMAVALDRSIGLSWSRHRVAIETKSELTRGMTVVDRLNVSSDDNNAPVWGAATGEHDGADILWTLDSRRFKAMLKAALLLLSCSPPRSLSAADAVGDRVYNRRRPRPLWRTSMEAGRNLLGQETSPYLLQHAHNPVHWRAWSADALAEAKRRDCPILLSIGYAACHWCHVMAHESFEDPQTARLMNELFVNIKVDREERPDIDHIYMSALHALGQQGGWPLTMFLSPDGKPMIGGTYWPPDPRYGRPSFRQVLQSVDSAWRTQRDQMERRGLTLADHLAKLSNSTAGPGVTPADLTRVGDALKSAVDPVRGGLSGAPKFPNAPIFRFFWNEMFRRGDPSFGEALRAMLEAMNAGGIYDHLGGGYARYSTDAEWLVPHFEKMLYDNAQILELLALVHSLWPDPTFAERARATVGWLMREMRVGDAFAASLDADQDGEEGLFYVWRDEEIDAALGESAARFKAAYDVTPEGNWEGRTVLRRIGPRGSAQEEAGLAASRAKLRALREARPKPGRDDKVLADWNGLTIAALARASATFDEPAWLVLARAAFDFVMRSLRGPDGRLLHAWREGHPGARALLDDYAAMARAALVLFEASGQPDDLEAARRLAREALELFGDGAGGFYLTAKDAADVPGARPRQTHDGATPSGVGLLAETFVRLWHLTDEPSWREAAEGLIRAVSGAPEGLGGSPLTLMSADMLERGGSVVIDGPLDDPTAQALASAALRAPDPSLTTLRLDRRLWPEGPPRADLPQAAEPIAMLCQGQTCTLPVTTPEALWALMEARREGSG